MTNSDLKKIHVTEDRFDRFRRIDWWDQDKMRDARVLVIGAGALGNEVIKNLALLGIGNLAIVDMDRIEASNLCRSVLFRQQDEGRPKAEVAAQAARGIYPAMKVAALVGNLMADVGLGWFRWADVVVGALDNREARVAVNSNCAQTGRAWIDGGIEVLNGIVRGFAPPETACYECTMGQADWEQLNKRRSCSLLARHAFAGGGTPTTPTTASVIGAIQAQEVVKRLHDLAALSGSGYVFEGLGHSSFPVEYSLNPDCPWHEAASPIEAVNEFSAATNLAEIWAHAERKLGGLDALDLAREIVSSLNCSSCGTQRDIFKPLDRITAAEAVCRQCSAECYPNLVHSIDRDSDWLQKKAGDFGLPAWDVIWRERVARRLVSNWLGTLGKHNCTSAACRGSPVGAAATESRGNVSRKNKNKETVDAAGQPAVSNASGSAGEAKQVQVETSGWVNRQVNTTRREFPAEAPVDEPLRIAFTAAAHAEIVAHAKDDLERELCGVLLGTVCEDSRGRWVSAEVALRGETDKQGGTHVTYTHQTWEKIYEQKDKKYPKLAILGWYHTHPGFGVQFSDMDLFIQRNFFPGDTQFALVVDPVDGDEAIVANTAGDPQYVSRFWVDGKEHKSKIPRDHAAGPEETAGDAALSAALDDRLKDVEERLAQVLQSNEAQREAHGRLFLIFGFLCVILVAGCIAYMLFENYFKEHGPPKDLEMVNVPVRINGKVMMIGMQVKGWEIPDSENLLKQMEADAEQRAFQRALKTLLSLEQRGDESPEEMAKPMLSPTVTYYWACGASLLAMGLLAALFIRRRS